MEQRTCSFDELPVILNATDIAGVLGVSRAFAYNLFHSAGFPVVVIGKRRLVRRDRFIDWLEKRELEIG